MARESESGIPIELVYGPEQLAGFSPAETLGEPGEYPFTRGVYPTMYAGRPWTMRQYAGFATAADSNRRYHQLIAAGTTGLSVAFDLPTQMGYDSDAALAHGEVGKVGVAIDSIEDMRRLLRRHPAGQGLDVDDDQRPRRGAAAALPAGRRGAGRRAGRLTGTVQNDILKEYIARGTYIYPPQPSLRLVADTFAYCRDRDAAVEHDLDLRLPHGGGRGDPVRRSPSRWPTPSEYVRAALGSGLAVDEFAPRLSFFFVARTTLLEEVAKFRAARRIWAHIMREEFGATDPRSQMLRFHTQTAGVQLTAQQPEVNMVRVTIQALAAVLGGTQSLHTNSYDEAIGLPSQKAATLAVRTQQVIANETDLTATVDPFAGSYAVESMTDEIEAAARPADRPGRGGGRRGRRDRARLPEGRDRAVRLPRARQVESGERVVVGVNKFQADEEEPHEPLRVDPAIEREQAELLAELRSSRNGAEHKRRLDDLRRAAEGTQNVLVPLREALRARATVGEVCDALREVWGVYQPPDAD